MPRPKTSLLALNVLRSAIGSSDRRARLSQLEAAIAGAKAASEFSAPVVAATATENGANALRSYFDAHQDGRGIWKWLHYFDIYERHFRKFVGREVHVVEIGVYSGGSLDLWHHYFGDGCRVHGVDIEAACRSYETERTQIHIGDQADRTFWQRFREQVPVVDIVIDDGGHEPEQQIVTLEETLPHIRPGGVFLCEDIHGVDNRFSSYAHAFANSLNSARWTSGPPTTRQTVTSAPTPLQAAVSSVHFYPFVTVIERTPHEVTELMAPPHGTSWQPFLGG